MTLVPGNNSLPMTSIVDIDALSDSLVNGFVTLSISGQSAIYNGEHLTYYVRHPSPLFPNVSELTHL
jgi:hypothetical protein